MFAKRLFLKATHRHLHHEKSSLTPEDVGFRINVHYGIPSTASILAFDPIQRLLAVGTQDGRIKVIGGDNIEGLLISPKLLPYKYLEFLQNQGILISIMNDNEIQIWNMERRSITCSLQWESNVTAFSVISGSSFIYVGDEYGLMSVLKYDAACEQLLRLPYHLSLDLHSEAVKYPFAYRQPIVGVLPQPCSSGNRLIIAYESGPIILWDVIQSHIVDVRGDKVLHLKSEVVSENNLASSNVDENSSNNIEKEISSLCWASNDGSILAVGYVDGDILFWNGFIATSRKAQRYGTSKNVVKLQFSSSQKRLPVVVLHWMAENKSENQTDGQLFIYGGDGIGCEEVVTVLSLEWTSGTEVLRCKGRVDLTLAGSFCDMIIIPSSFTARNKKDASLFVLSDSGQILIFESATFSFPSLQRRKELPSSAVSFPVCIQTVDPLMTVAEFFYFYGSGSRQPTIAELSNYRTKQPLPGAQKWRLTGGVANHISFSKVNKVDKLYIAGYQDGSARIWDATYPVFSLICVLTPEACCESMVSSGASVSKMDFCFSTLRLAVGDECGLVKLYNLSRIKGSSFHYVTETKHEVSTSAQVEGPWCEAVINLHKSGVQDIKFTNEGTKLIVGYEFAKIAVLDLNSWSLTLTRDSISSHTLVSVLWEASVYGSIKNTNEIGPIIPNSHSGELVFVLTKNANIYVINANTGSLINSRPLHLKRESSAISMYIIETHRQYSHSANDEQILKDDPVTKDHSQNEKAQGSEKCESDTDASDKTSPGELMKEFLFLLCCEDALRIYPANSVINGENKYIHKIKLAKPCCWTSLLRKEGKVCGLVIIYKTGEIEIRSVTDLKMVKEYSLMSDLRWNFQSNMERTFSSTANGQITMANGCEVAFISLLTGKSDFWIPVSQANLHDEVFAAAADTAISVSSKSKLKQGMNPGILDAFKGLKRKKSSKLGDIFTPKYELSHLEDIFRRNPFLESSMTTSEQEAHELTIDDIEIDELLPSESSLSREVVKRDKDKKTEREKLFDGDADVKPKVRTREEIEAIYRTGDASSVAGEARNKLLERQQKLEKTKRQTEELQNEAKEFASLTDELVKAMENRKWYHI